jgi:hypothetical protein
VRMQPTAAGAANQSLDQINPNRTADRKPKTNRLMM